jgi:hypothetical protein
MAISTPPSQAKLWADYCDARIATVQIDVARLDDDLRNANADLEKIQALYGVGSAPEQTLLGALRLKKQVEWQLQLALARQAELEALKNLVLAIPDERRTVSIGG